MNASHFSLLTFTGLFSCAVAAGLAGCGSDSSGGDNTGGTDGGGGSATGGTGGSTGGSSTGGSSTGGSSTGGSSTGGSSTGGSGTGGSSTGGSGTGGAGTGGSGTGGQASDGGGDLCTQYCDIIMEYCTDADGGSNAQYTSNAECLTTCADFATTGSTGDTSGDTVQCRITHAQYAGDMPTMAAAHCDHAGPSGGGECI